MDIRNIDRNNSHQRDVAIHVAMRYYYDLHDAWYAKHPYQIQSIENGYPKAAYNLYEKVSEKIYRGKNVQFTDEEVKTLSDYFNKYRDEYMQKRAQGIELHFSEDEFLADIEAMAELPKEETQAKQVIVPEPDKKANNKDDIDLLVVDLNKKYDKPVNSKKDSDSSWVGKIVAHANADKPRDTKPAPEVKQEAAKEQPKKDTKPAPEVKQEVAKKQPEKDTKPTPEVKKEAAKEQPKKDTKQVEEKTNPKKIDLENLKIKLYQKYKMK